MIRAQVAADPDGPSDRELLGRFAAGRDGAAFEAVLRRHGPMVLRACRRMLDRREDAEDVFQATFLVLARKAGAVAWRESVGTWLYEVAHRLARDVRRQQARRHAREAAAGSRPAADPLADISGRELLAALDEELAGLPARYRDPLLLCCLEGKSGDEAARDLGCSASTLKRRLRSARDLLQARLDRRGLALPATAVASLLFLGPATAVPPGLADGTARAAVLLAAGEPLADGLVSAPALASAAAVRVAGPSRLWACAVGLAAAVGLGVGGWAVVPVDRPAPAAEVVARKPVPLPSDRPVPAGGPVRATAESTLPTAGDQIRQFAFDGRPDTWYESARPAGPADHFTLRFDRPVDVRSVAVDTGRPDGGDRLDAGVLEVSTDGTRFAPAGAFLAGAARVELGGRAVRAVRVRPPAGRPLVVREVAVESTPPVARFADPVEYVADAADAPDLGRWAAAVARLCERHHAAVCDDLRGAGIRPRPVVRIRVAPEYVGVAEAEDGRITLSADYFRAHPDDVGAVFHVAVYVAQAYPEGAAPRWLAAGIADYLRFYRFEPDRLGRVDRGRAIDSHSRVTAAFLRFVAERHGDGVVRDLHALLRAGEYTPDSWADLTGRTLDDLAAEWRAAARGGPTASRS
jgi:RNA polymerase sigma factor (sigma-70 family)